MNEEGLCEEKRDDIYSTRILTAYTQDNPNQRNRLRKSFHE